MGTHRVTRFQQYPFAVGQRVHIADGPRRGDWEVVDIDRKNVTLRCPISGRELTWARFCYAVDEVETDRPAEHKEGEPQ